MKHAIVATFFLISFVQIASAQKPATPPMQMGGTNMQPKGDNGPASQAFNAAMMKMDQGMDITYTGDPDKDFVAGMIPHHQGAVDMANVELQYGKDPSLRKLARNIVATQQREIAMMKKWRRQHAK
ncbi:MAG TPA: DUF305 domain-containing protein [Methylocella sp.]|nr:DUF305 domain-containing protein [Methylocella sp.]